MRKPLSLTLGFSLFIALSIQSNAIHLRAAARAGDQTIPAPADVLGFTPGDDRRLASWAKVVEYFQKLAAASDRVKFEEIGKTTMGAPFVYATISLPENLKRLNEFKEIQRQLADPRLLDAGSADAPVRNERKARTKEAGEGARDPSDRKAADLIKRGKTIVAITCGIHSTEVGSYLSSMLIAYRLASSNDPEVQEILKNTIILLVPSTNPDGVDIVNNWYQKTLGTPYEGTDPPELYHKYTGHDDNRDWYAFTQVETQLVVDKILNVWHPQIVHDIHQQGAFGSRLFLPPYMQPVEPNVPKQIVEGYTELGNYLAKEMRATGYKGITTDSTYDAWSPSRAYSHYHGGVRILQETASCRLATPITVRFDQLRPGENYDPRKEAPNFGPVWQGGEWHIRDITNTMTTVAFLLLKHAAQNRDHWLQRFYEIEKEAVRPRKTGELWGYGLGYTSKNYLLFDYALHMAGVEIDWCETGKHEVSKFVKLAQPYGGFAKALLESQKYPDLRDSNGRPIAPYDVTAHTLSMMTNVVVTPVRAPFRCKQADWDDTNVLPGYPSDKRLALYKSHVPAIDEGWTRWVIQQNGNYYYPVPQVKDSPQIQFVNVEDQQVRRGNLGAAFDTIIIPDQPRAAILNGHRKGTMPDEYTGGLGAEGVKALREFVEAGGTLVCLNRASDFAIEQFKLPVRDVVDGLPRTDFYVPGSILRIELDTSNPIANGMPKESIAWAENSPAFELTENKDAGESARAPSVSLTQRGSSPTVREGVSLSAKIIAWYPTDKDPLLSGWLLGGDRIKGKAALVEVDYGKGRIILFGFRPQYRGQSLTTYPLFFNAITQH